MRQRDVLFGLLPVAGAGIGFIIYSIVSEGGGIDALASKILNEMTGNASNWRGGVEWRTFP